MMFDGSHPRVSGFCGSTGIQPLPGKYTSAQLWLAKLPLGWFGTGGMRMSPHTGRAGTPAARHSAVNSIA